MRLTAFASRGWDRFHKIFIAALIVGAIVQLILGFTQCTPYIGDIRALGRKNTTPKCMAIFSLGVGYSVWHILSDCLLFIVPIMMLWRVQMKFWTKFSVCIAGTVGLGNVAVSLARVLVENTAKGKRGAFDLTCTFPPPFPIPFLHT